MSDILCSKNKANACECMCIPEMPEWDARKAANTHKGDLGTILAWAALYLRLALWPYEI